MRVNCAHADFPRLPAGRYRSAQGPAAGTRRRGGATAHDGVDVEAGAERTRVGDRAAQAATGQTQAHAVRRKSEKLDRKIEELETRLEDLVAEEGASDQQAGSTAPRRKSERRPLPEHLMREERVLEPQEQACAQCGGELKPLGEDVSEQLDIIDSAFKVIRHIRRKKACACCDHIAQAAAPRRAGRSSAVSPVPACWRKSWWPSMPTTSHCTASRPSTRGTAWNWTARRWGVGWAPAAPSCAPWSPPCKPTCSRRARSTPMTRPCPCSHQVR